MQTLKCPVCHEKVYSKAGFGCMMCGMPLKNLDVDFCCDNCKEIYKEINIVVRTNTN